MVTTANIISFISDGTYPYPIRFVTGEQKFKVYPYCEVVETSPRAKTEDAETITTVGKAIDYIESKLTEAG